MAIGGRPPAVDSAGNALIAFSPSCEEDGRCGMRPLPLALVALWCGRSLLMVFDNARGQWELPGGMIDPGESPRRAALRELREETGYEMADPLFAGHARFLLGSERRTEYAAVYAGEVARADRNFTPNREIAAIRWWNGVTPLPGRVQPIDVALGRLARHVLDNAEPA